MQLIDINTEDLFNYLDGMNRPVEELELLKIFAPDSGNAGRTAELFHRHFSLYHALYKIRQAVGSTGYYTHLDPMRIRCLRIPGEHSCHYYNPEAGIFCCRSTAEYACDKHKKQEEDSLHTLVPDFLSGFYLDSGNIMFGESGELRKYTESLNFYLLNRKEIEKAHRIFGIDRPDKNSISARYRQLAKMLHPDRNSSSGDSMKELNGAYSLLQKIYI